jgi:pimeloyl-ACP methyl ester carboxylesterase
MLLFYTSSFVAYYYQIINRFSGVLANWSVIDNLHLVRVPTLVINGRADMAQDFVCAPFARRIKNATWVTFEGSSHTPMWEEREKYMDLVRNFLSQ